MQKKCLGLLALLCLYTLFACGNEDSKVQSNLSLAEDDATILTILYSGTDIKKINLIETLCESFMLENSDIVLKLEQSEDGDYVENLKVRVALDTFPDIMEIQNPSIFASEQLLGEIPSAITALIEHPIYYDGKNYAIPFYGTTYGMVYNKKLFAQHGLAVPQTYDDFLELCSVLQANGITPLALGGNTESVTQAWGNYFLLRTASSFEADWQDQLRRGELKMTDERMVDMLEDFRILMTSSFILKGSIDMSEGQVLAKLIQGEVAMYYATPDVIGRIVEADPNSEEALALSGTLDTSDAGSAFSSGWFFLPDESGNVTAAEKTHMYWAVSADCMRDDRKAQAAERFLSFCYEKDNYREVLQTMYATACTKQAVIYPSLAVQRDLLTEYRYANKSDASLQHIGTPVNAGQSFYTTMNLLASGIITTEEAAEQLQSALYATLEDIDL